MKGTVKMNAQRIKAVLLLILLSVSIVGLSGCLNQASSPDDSRTRVVVDCVGREVEIPQEVNSVACLYAFAGHVTTLLGEADKICAVVDGVKRDKLLTQMFPHILEVSVPFTQGVINVEELAKINPDVVLIQSSTHNNRAEMEKLAAFNLPAVVVDTRTMEEQRQAVLVIGQVLGGTALEKARLYDAYYQQTLDLVDEKARLLDPEQKVRVFHSVNEATRTDAAGSLVAQWMERTGLVSVAADQELNPLEGKMYASLEQIYLWDPDVIVCNEVGVPNYILTDSKWAGLTAVKNQTVYQMPIAVSRWGHHGSMETPLAMYWMGKLVYPWLYEDVRVEEETRYFYETFFEYTLSDRQIAEILAGEGMRLQKTN